MTVRRYKVADGGPVFTRDTETPLRTASLYVDGEKVGFVPLEEIQPRYRVQDFARVGDPQTHSIGVLDETHGILVASFGAAHPNPAEAAAAECQRLNDLGGEPS